MPQKKQNTSATPNEIIVSKIHVIRQQKVILDFDLAVLYEVQTRRLNEQVKRNMDRFPEEFMFRLTTKEWQSIMSQFATSSPQKIDLQPSATMKSQNATASQKKRKSSLVPYAFTEHGVTMVAMVLKSDRAIKMSLAVVRTFIDLKKFAVNYNGLAKQIQELRLHIGKHDAQLNSIYEAIENLLDENLEKKTWENRKRIGFKNG